MTGDRTQAQQLYKAGRALYAEQRFEEALSAFDRVSGFYLLAQLPMLRLRHTTGIVPSSPLLL